MTLELGKKEYVDMEKLLTGGVTVAGEPDYMLRYILIHVECGPNEFKSFIIEWPEVSYNISVRRNTLEQHIETKLREDGSVDRAMGSYEYELYAGHYRPTEQTLITPELGNCGRLLFIRAKSTEVKIRLPKRLNQKTKKRKRKEAACLAPEPAELPTADLSCGEIMNMGLEETDIQGILDRVINPSNTSLKPEDVTETLK